MFGGPNLTFSKTASFPDFPWPLRTLLLDFTPIRKVLAKWAHSRFTNRMFPYLSIYPLFANRTQIIIRSFHGGSQCHIVHDSERWWHNNHWNETIYFNQNYLPLAKWYIVRSMSCRPLSLLIPNQRKTFSLYQKWRVYKTFTSKHVFPNLIFKF